MINVDNNFRLVNDLLSKNNGEYITPSQYNRYAKLASNGRYGELLGIKKVGKSTYGTDRKLDSRLRQFRDTTLPLPVVSGVVSLPDDCEFITAVYLTDLTPLRTVDEDRFARIMKDPLADPISADPVYKEDVTSIRVYPSTVDFVIIEYLKKPQTPSWNYSVVSGRPVYDPLTSVDFDWNDTEEAEITMRILQYCGVSMSDNEVMNYTESKIQQE